MTVAGLLVVASAVWFASSWIDTGSDSTCGSVLRPSVWLDDSAAGSYRTVMPLRLGVAVASGLTGLAMIYAATTGGRIVSTRAAVAVGVITCVAVSVMLLVNEAVRSDGAL